MSDKDSQKPPERHDLVDIEEELKKSYLDYAMSVIIGRALPDVRDGLKPVHRRVLYGMWEGGNRAGRPFKKSARIVGDVMGKYHPHGDMAIYDSVVRMAQDFSMRYTLVDGQGNFGSVDGDNAAAMRYTEIRLTHLAEEMLGEDLGKATVEWLPNYDETEEEPEVLPATVPNLLVNGSAGIAVGMATNIPPHNLGEVIDAVLLLIENPGASLAEIMDVLPGPDFPTGGFIHGRSGIRSAYESGRGLVRVRARADIESRSGGKTEGEELSRIVIRELPYQVNKAKLVQQIADLVRAKRLEGVSDLRDESDREGVRIAIDLKRGEIPEVILNNLYKHTQLQTTFGINLLAIVDQQPRVLSLPEILRHFLNHRRAVITRRTRFDLGRAEERAHILEGILKALDELDAIIATIRASQTPADARTALVSQFELSLPQAEAILEMRLQRLTGLEREKVQEEYHTLLATIERLKAILGSDQLVLEEIKGELEAIRERYGDHRRTEIVAGAHDPTIEDMIADDDMVITVSRMGYVKRSPLALYRAQHRGGKGRMGMLTKDGDVVEQLYVASAHSYVLVFTESGRVHWLKVHQIPQAGPAAKGKAIVNLLQLEEGERAATTVAVREFSENRFLVFASERGVVKKTRLNAFSRPRQGGIIAAVVDPDDHLLSVKVTDGDHDVFLATADGYSIRFSEKELRALGRVTRGVKGISLRAGDKVVSMEVLDRDGDLVSVAELGFGKGTHVGEYRIQGRGGKGILNLKLSPKTGRVMGVRLVDPGDELMLVSQEGKIIRIGADGIRRTGRAAMGVKVMDLEGEDRLVAFARITDEAGQDDDQEAQGETEAPEPVN